MKEQEVKETSNEIEEFGCPYCWNKKKQQSKELYFFDAANNLRLCQFCPNCGRPYGEEHK